MQRISTGPSAHSSYSPVGGTVLGRMKLRRASLGMVLGGVLVMGGLAVLPGAASASPSTTLWVNNAVAPSGSHNSCTSPGYSTIQAAINAALPGKTVEVC